ncbi:Ccdc192 [Phodopus roborovskii]|uniref:Ccdc192 protein n=1 Tax=Phodopus roborovskii TaxID=109678 RepID=A0AAU9ZY53_PHORO|nr:Ccdc192 [Phodopus roborovskii]
MRLVGVCSWTEDQWSWPEMGGCHSKKVVIPDFETPVRCSGQTAAFTLEQLEHLEICLKEAEEKAKVLLEQCIEKLQAEVKASQEKLTAHTKWRPVVIDIWNIGLRQKS